MGWEFFISLRYLLAKRKEKFISVSTFLSIISVTVGVAVLIIVLGVMNGFGDELRQKIVGFNYHVYIEKSDGIKNPDFVINKVNSSEDVLSSTPFIDGQAIVLVESREPRGVLVRGIDAAREKPYISLEVLSGDKFQLKNNGVAIGNELARSLKVSPGDRINIISGASIVPREFKISSIFHSGMYEYDANLIFTNLDSAKVLFDTKDTVNGIGLRVKSLAFAQRVKKAVLSSLGNTYLVHTWSELNKNLFAAIKMEKVLVFIVVTLTIAVGALNIINTLSLLTLEKTKDIGILKALGATRLNIAKIYMSKGLVIGLIGSSMGLVFGVSITKNINLIAGFISKLTGFELFSREIYYLDKIPVSMNYSEIWLIIFFAIGLSFLAALYPAWHASRLNPIEALRYE